MPIALGLDTGGTYTDGVLLDLTTRTLLAKAKCLTTREDLSIGIRGCIDSLDCPRFDAVSLVALSTTLATNAIIEGRGCRVGLILIGHEAVGNFPAQEVASVAGGHDIKGCPVTELDIAALQKALRGMQGKVDTLAISSYLSVRNPEHELLALREIKDFWDVPVVCAHQLTTTLGFHERTVTACLNAQLLPIVAELLSAVKRVLAEKKIEAPLMVARGNGSLMSEEVTKEKPIQTILSGPAASIVGATFLTGQKKALVLDMGGTTTDIALLEKGRPGVNSEGAVVGGWKTRVEAAEISTFGIGGDSYIRVSPGRGLSIGPKRVWPLAVAAKRYPQLISELAGLSEKSEVRGYQPVDCWTLVKRPLPAHDWSGPEWQVIRALEDGAHNIFELANRVGQYPSLLPMARLEQAQVVGRISLTPTDLLHAAGRFTQWNVEAATATVCLQAKRMNLTNEDFLHLALAEVENALSRTILQSIISKQGYNIDLAEDPGAGVFLGRFLRQKAPNGLGVELYLDYPIVAIGAPVPAYLPLVGKRFHTEVLIPEHAEVANAVGAAVGQVVETVRVLVKPGAEGGFVVHAPWEWAAFSHLEEAERYAVERAREVAQRNAARAGAAESRLMVEKETKVAHSSVSNDDLFVETQIEVTAVGPPIWGESRMKSKVLACYTLADEINKVLPKSVDLELLPCCGRAQQEIYAGHS
ncbi:acetophenone carboxylase gamma subunit [Peptococcaceae bacterium CEB3]|nr:acetophenone carboxylase gamma subunit [Peptococcaceae bacterium CEB3]